MKTVVLLSGGMDSVTAFYEVRLQHEIVAALSFDYGSKHNAREIPFAKLHAERAGVPHRSIDLGFMNDCFASDLLKSGGDIPDGHYAEENMKRTVVPFRNGIMLSVACGFSESIEAEALAISSHSGDKAIYPACREPFMQGMAAAMQEGTYARIQLMRPFIAMDKTAIARRGVELGIDFSETWSCYKGGEIHCGTCGTCVERREAFILAGLPDPTVYLATPEIPAAPQ